MSRSGNVCIFYLDVNGLTEWIVLIFWIYSEVMAAAERLQSRIFSGMDSAEAWNEVSVDLVRCAKVNLANRLNLERVLRNCCLWCSVEEELSISIVGCAGCDGRHRWKLSITVVDSSLFSRFFIWLLNARIKSRKNCSPVQNRRLEEEETKVNILHSQKMMSQCFVAINHLSPGRDNCVLYHAKEITANQNTGKLIICHFLMYTTPKRCITSICSPADWHRGILCWAAIPTTWIAWRALWTYAKIS